MSWKKQSLVVLIILTVLLQAACTGNQTTLAQGASGAATAPPSTGTQTVAVSREGRHWSYEGESGPVKWDTLSADWKICGDGRSQSPINIEKTAKVNSAALQGEFKPVSLNVIRKEHVADVINNGHAIQINYTNGDTLKIGEQQFPLLQYHFHSPSEHTVGGKQYPMEMHLVHTSADGSLAVIGVFIEEGRPNAAFAAMRSDLPRPVGSKYHLDHVKIDIDRLLPSTKTVYRYDGSLTTPPCSEGVKWIIMTTPIQLSPQQIAAFRAIKKDNNRPVQARNGRTVVTDRIAQTATNQAGLP